MYECSILDLCLWGQAAAPQVSVHKHPPPKVPLALIYCRVLVWHEYFQQKRNSSLVP